MIKIKSATSPETLSFTLIKLSIFKCGLDKKPTNAQLTGYFQSKNRYNPRSFTLNS
ncbi:Uncharacterized protein YR821_2457 [Yersinia ruckeri]|nr:hypothetical protein yruck0001_9360 [Yersinia ruckeri ATCC 29473]QTD77375.1 Uncharacterized protein YR821_2457 [Yersinia ruckeri]